MTANAQTSSAQKKEFAVKEFSPETPIKTIEEDPAFSKFGKLLFPPLRDESLKLSQERRLMPYHTNVDPVLSAKILNEMRSDAERGEKIFFPLSGTDNNPTSGLFFFRGKPDAPFAVVNPGGGFQYVGAIHEGFPVARWLAEQGINAFVLVYHTGSAEVACQDLAKAIDFIFDHAKSLHVSTEGYSLWGGSAGARMAAYLGAYSPRAFGGKTQQRPSAVIMQYTGHSDLGGQNPATFAVVGDGDPIASPYTMENRIQRLQRQGIPAEFKLIHGVSHGFGLGNGTPAQGWEKEALKFWLAQNKRMQK